jgi:hypothetical protein
VGKNCRKRGSAEGLPEEGKLGKKGLELPERRKWGRKG